MILAFDPNRRNNAQLIRDCHTLGYLPTKIVDLTYGKGTFWKLVPNLHPQITANDLDPTKGDVHHDFTATRFQTNEFATAVFDPPYRLGGTPSTETFDDAYGIQVPRTKSEIRELIERGTAEACRIASQFVLVKIQDHVSSGNLQPLSNWVISTAEDCGATLVDSLHVVGGRSQPQGRRQVRARHGYSTLLVFEP